MNQSTAKLLRKIARRQNLPYRLMKRAYREANIGKRTQLKKELRAILKTDPESVVYQS